MGIHGLSGPFFVLFHGWISIAMVFSHVFTTPGLARRASPRSPWVPQACPPAARLEGHPEPRTWCEQCLESSLRPHKWLRSTHNWPDGMSVALSFLESGVTFVKSSHVLGEKMHRHATNRYCRADVPHMIRWSQNASFIIFPVQEYMQ